MSIEDNVAYGHTALQISTENNIAYVQSTMAFRSRQKYQINE